MIENLLRLVLSTCIGWILGRERKRHSKEGGGSRTLAIVSLSSCLIAILSLEIMRTINPITFNFSRMMSYCVVGIGFLGSAVIVNNKGKLEGVTTASLIWASVPINFCIGLGFYIYAVTSAFLVFIILESKYISIRRIKKRSK